MTRGGGICSVTNYPDGMTRHDWFEVGEVDECEHGDDPRRCRECNKRDPDDARDERDARTTHDGMTRRED